MITAPRHGEKMRADWGADVARAVNALAPCGARGLVREGVAGCGAEPLPGNLRAMRRKPHVFEVFAHAEDGDSSPLLTIHLPAGCVWYGGESLVPDGVTALGASRPDEWEFDFESDLGETKTVIYLVISEDDYGEVSAEFVKALADVGGTVKAVLPVAEVSIETVTEGSGSITAGVVHRQLARHPFTVVVGGGGDDDDGKLIESTSVEASSDPGGQNKIVFNYTDGSSDTFIVMNGLKGPGGNPGMDGDTPEIEVTKNGNITYIYVDGELVAQITDGSTPKITASKIGKITTIYADGVPIATINDGEDGGGGGEQTDMEVITGVTFSMSEDTGKLTAKLTRKKIKAVVVETLEPEEVEVATVKQVPVVTSEAYSTSSHQFTNERRLVTVLGDAAAQGQTPFTATPLSSE